MKARVEYTIDYCSENGDDQRGRVIVHPQSGGRVQGTWLCEGGMGSGTELDENTTTCWDDEQAEFIVDGPEICQGIGIFDCDIEFDQYGHPIVENVVFVEESQEPDGPKIKIKVTLRPKKVVVEYKGQTHSARWRERDGMDGELFEIDGNANLCQAALTAWYKEREFSLTEEELVELGGGWWAV